MPDLLINQTASTPEVQFSLAEKKLMIKGICTPENPRLFFEPVMSMLLENKDNYDVLTISLGLNYYNSGSAKALLNILIEAGNCVNGSNLIKVQWFSDDEEIREAGKTFEELSGLHFEYVNELH